MKRICFVWSRNEKALQLTTRNDLVNKAATHQAAKKLMTSALEGTRCRELANQNARQSRTGRDQTIKARRGILINQT